MGPGSVGQGVAGSGKVTVLNGSRRAYALPAAYYQTTMGKQSKLKAARKLTAPSAKKSAKEIAYSYLAANDEDAAFFRLRLVDQFLDKMVASFTPAGKPISMTDVLRLMPKSFALAYIRLVGHSLAGSRHKYFWPQIKNDLLTISTGPENEEALKDWGRSAGEVALFNDMVARQWCYSGLQQLGEHCAPIRIYGMRAEVLQNGWNQAYLDVIPTHLVISSCIAKNQIVHQAGSLILCYAEDYKGNQGKELWLVKKRHDGIYATSAEARDGTLKLPEVRDMRQFIQNYQGLPMQGRLCPAREKEAARICRFVGLSVNGDHAFLQSSHREES
jgi:hypothetical protein